MKYHKTPSNFFRISISKITNTKRWIKFSNQNASLRLLVIFLISVVTMGNLKSINNFSSISLAPIHNQHHAKPPVLSKQNVNWWRRQGSPEPIMGWKTLDSILKTNISELNQQVDKQGKWVFLLNLNVGKKGKVNFVEIFDSNVADTTLLNKLNSQLYKIPFTPYKSSKGKIIHENCLVLMELSALLPSEESMRNDTLISNKEIKSARFLGGEDLFLRYVSDEFVYPSRCLESEINGYVLIRFMVDRNGFVSRCQIIEGSRACPEFGKEAIRIFYLCPKWIPATHEGKNINAYFQVPISLKVN
jgi:TonB family protein